MRARVKDFRVVEKDSHQFDDGTISYRVTGGNGEGGLCRLGVENKELWDALVPYDQKYELVVEVRMSGFKTYADIVTAGVVKQ